MKKHLIWLLVIASAAGIVFFLSFSPSQPPQHNDNTVTTSSKTNLIKVHSPAPLSVVSSPLTVAGQARGGWFFEASFPLTLTDGDGKIIAQSYATAQGEWMTENFVPFTGTLMFKKPLYGKNGTLILKKDNPSGLPEYDDALEIPILFE